MGSPRQWGWQEHLLVAQLHAAQAANWQRGGGKGAKPKPLKPPGRDAGDRRHVGTALPVDDMRRVLDEWSPPAPQLLGPDGEPITSEVNDVD